MAQNFEDVISAYLNWTNLIDVTDLIRQLEALTVIKHLPKWYIILKRNRRKTLDRWLFTCKDIRQYPTPVGAHMQLYLFTHWFHFIERGKRYVHVGMILKRSSVCMTIGRIQWKMLLIWSDNWKHWRLSNIRPDMVFNPIILSFCHTIPSVTCIKIGFPPALR